MLTPDKIKNNSLSDDHNKFIITSINGSISDSSGLIFGHLLLIKCTNCDKTFNDLNENYNHFKHKHKSDLLVTNNNNNNNDSNHYIIDDNSINSLKIRRKNKKSVIDRINKNNKLLVDCISREQVLSY